MFANAKALLVIVSCALVVQAQSPTGTAPSSIPTPDSCILGCVSTAATANGCVTFTNITCVCTSQSFQQAAQQCIMSQCPSSDLQVANQLQQEMCGASNSSTSATGTPASTGASTAASSSSSGSAAASHSATSSSAAMALSAPFSFGGLIGTLVASAGALVGAAFIL